jgi:hypothetical protein
MRSNLSVKAQQAGPCGCGCTTTAAKQQLGSRAGWYDKMYARMISRQTARYNQLLDARKKQLLSHVVDDAAVQDVLEVGVGSGANLPYYGAARKVCAGCKMLLTCNTPNRASRSGNVRQPSQLFARVAVFCLLMVSSPCGCSQGVLQIRQSPSL